jgi:hypothetical protein
MDKSMDEKEWLAEVDLLADPERLNRLQPEILGDRPQS